MADILQRVAMKAVIANDDGKLLVIREAASYAEGTQVGKYHFPGGRIEPGEHHLKGLQREIQEETGLSIEPLQPLYIGEWQPVIKDVPHQIVAIFMLCKLRPGKLQLGADADDYKWIDPANVGDLVLMEPDGAVITAYQALKTDKR